MVDDGFIIGLPTMQKVNSNGDLIVGSRRLSTLVPAASCISLHDKSMDILGDGVGGDDKTEEKKAT